MQSDTPLAGKLVIDLTQGVAGPYCGRLLAEHGARVIKIEPPAGDWIRGLGTGPGGVSVHFLYYNLGKETLVLDLKTESGLADARRLIARADVFLQSARPGVMDRLGLGFDAMKALNPRLVYLSVSGFGLEGPRARDPMTDTVAQAFSGIMSINTGADGVPHKMHSTIVDAVTGMFGFQAVSMALMAGPPEARHLDVSLMQSAAALIAPKVMEFAHLGETPASLNAPAGSYRTADGWIALTLVREAHFVALAEAIGQTELATDPRFCSFALRSDNLAALTEIVSEALARRTTAQWQDIFDAHGIMASAVHDFGDWRAEPQVVASDGAPEVTVYEDARSPAPRTPGRCPMNRPARALGQDGPRLRAEFDLTQETP